LAAVKELVQEQKESFQELIRKQEEQYQQERQEREADHQKRMENLMRFQISDKSVENLKNRPSHNRSNSFTSLLSYRDNSSEIVAGPSLNSPTLSDELNQVKNRRPNSLLFKQNSPVEESENKLEQSLQEVMNLVDVKVIFPDESTDREKALLEEINRLTDENAHLANA